VLKFLIRTRGKTLEFKIKQFDMEDFAAVVSADMTE